MGTCHTAGGGEAGGGTLEATALRGPHCFGPAPQAEEAGSDGVEAAGPQLLPLGASGLGASHWPKEEPLVPSDSHHGLIDWA